MKSFEGERWKTVKGFERYQVSNHGRVKRLPFSFLGSNGSIKKKHDTVIVKQFNSRKGYPTVFLSIPNTGKTKGFRVHRLVVEYFYKGFNSKLHVDHLDMNKENNHISNLEMVTNAENLRRSHSYGSHSTLEVRNKSRPRTVSNSNIKKIRQLYFSKENKSLGPYENSKKVYSTRALAKMFDTTQPTVSAIVNQTGAYAR